ncbi:MAG TPA: DUF2812 domain-containing protein [Anaerolineaceae bacterium]
MKTNTLRKIKVFWAWEDDREEAWLRSMSLQGWHLASLPFPMVYTFTRGEPKDIVYRMDYKSSPNTDMADYLSLFHDAGWEHIGRMASWQYFRKERTDDDLPEIYTDAESKIQKYRRLLLILGVLSPLYLSSTINISKRADDPLGMGLLIFMIVFALFYIYAIVRLWMRIRELQKL